MKNIFSLEELPKKGFFQKFSSESKSNTALVELNNLFAQKDIDQIKRSEINVIENKYSLSFSKNNINDILQMLRKAILHYLNDDEISSDNYKKLSLFKELLNIDNEKYNNTLNEMTGDKFRKFVLELLNCGEFEKAQFSSLKNVCDSLKLSQNKSTEIYTQCINTFVNEYLISILSDQRFSPEEKNQLEEIQRRLDIKFNLGEDVEKLLKKFENNWKIENSDIPIIDTDISLEKNEECYFKSKVSYFEKRTITKSINVSGPSISFKVAKGIRFKSSNLSVNKITKDEITLLGTGLMYLTNKRIIFLGSDKNHSIKIREILSFVPYSDGVEIVKDSGRNKFYKVEGDVNILSIILSRLINQ